MKPFTLLFLLLISACVNVTQFYRPYTTEVFPPKPKNHPIPILGQTPERKHTVIGRMAFQSTHSHAFNIRAIETTARKFGADAAIMLRNPSKLVQYAHHVPGYTEQRAVTTTTNFYANMPSRALGLSNPGLVGTGYSTSYVPVVHPGYTAVNTRVLEGMDVLMIRFE